MDWKNTPNWASNFLLELLFEGEHFRRSDTNLMVVRYLKGRAVLQNGPQMLQVYQESCLDPITNFHFPPTLSDLLPTFISLWWFSVQFPYI